MKTFFSVVLAVLFIPMVAFGAEEVLSLDAFLSQVIAFMQSMGGLSAGAKIAAGITLAISLTKLSALRPLWDKLGSWKVLVAPVLSIVAGLLSMGGEFSWAGLTAYLVAGAGAIALHEILDFVKAIPGVSPIVLTIANLISSLLGGKK